MKLIFVGATGLVGREVLKRALDDQRISLVVAPTRRALAAHPKLNAPLTNFDNLPETVDWWAGGCRDLHIGHDDAARWIERQFPAC